MIGAAGVLDTAAQTFDEKNLLIGLARALRVAEGGEEWRVDEVKDAADEMAAAGAVDLEELRDGIRYARALCVAGKQNPAHARNVSERAVLIGRNIEIAVAGRRERRRVELRLLLGADIFVDGEAFGDRLRQGGEEEEAE